MGEKTHGWKLFCRSLVSCIRHGSCLPQCSLSDPSSLWRQRFAISHRVHSINSKWLHDLFKKGTNATQNIFQRSQPTTTSSPHTFSFHSLTSLPHPAPAAFLVLSFAKSTAVQCCLNVPAIPIISHESTFYDCWSLCLLSFTTWTAVQCCLNVPAMPIVSHESTFYDCLLVLWVVGFLVDFKAVDPTSLPPVHSVPRTGTSTDMNGMGTRTRGSDTRTVQLHWNVFFVNFLVTC